MKSKFYFLLPLLLIFAFTACNSDDGSMDSMDSFKRDNNYNKPGEKTIYELALGAQLTELAGAIAYVDMELNAGLGAAIQSEEVQLTVFAPTNEAFVSLLAFLDAARPNETIDDITDIPAPIVLAVLQYHLVEGRRGSNSVVPKNDNNKTVETLFNGATFEVDSNAVIYAAGGNTAQIGPLGPTSFNISASNGIVHLIDTVILPLEPSDVLALWDSLTNPE